MDIGMDRVENVELTLEGLLKQLSKDPCYDVRLCVAHNPKTPRSVLNALTEDSNQDVKAAAYRSLLYRMETIMMQTCGIPKGMLR